MYPISAANTLSVVAVSFFYELGFKGSTMGILFFIVITFTIPGSFFAEFVTKRLKCPIKSMKICYLFFIAFNFVAFILLANPTNKNLTWLFSAIWGFILGTCTFCISCFFVYFFNPCCHFFSF